MELQLQMRSLTRQPYSSDVSDEEWAFMLPYLTLCREDAPQRRHDLREVFNAVRWMVRAGAPWRLIPHDFPPWSACYQQTQRWIRAGVFEAMVHDLRLFIRMGEGRAPDPSAVIMDARTLQSTPESGHRAGYDGHKRKKGSKLHMVVDTLGMLLTLKVTAANEQERAQVADLAAEVQALTSGEVELCFADQGYTGDEPRQIAADLGMQLEVVRLPDAKRGFVLLPRRWVVERSFAWMTRFRRLARDFERLPETLAGLHYLAFACLMVPKVVDLLKSP
jgi:transposase